MLKFHGIPLQHVWCTSPSVFIKTTRWNQRPDFSSAISEFCISCRKLICLAKIFVVTFWVSIVYSAISSPCPHGIVLLFFLKSNKSYFVGLLFECKGYFFKPRKITFYNSNPWFTVLLCNNWDFEISQICIYVHIFMRGHVFHCLLFNSLKADDLIVVISRWFWIYLYCYWCKWRSNDPV